MHLTQAQKAARALEKKKRSGGKKGSRKYGRNKKKCELYRARVGKPNGPMQSGNKAGKNRLK